MGRPIEGYVPSGIPSTWYFRSSAPVILRSTTGTSTHDRIQSVERKAVVFGHRVSVPERENATAQENKTYTIYVGNRSPRSYRWNIRIWSKQQNFLTKYKRPIHQGSAGRGRAMEDYPARKDLISCLWTRKSMSVSKSNDLVDEDQGAERMGDGDMRKTKLRCATPQAMLGAFQTPLSDLLSHLLRSRTSTSYTRDHLRVSLSIPLG